MWLKYQRCRLSTEAKVLAAELPQFRFYNPTGETYVAGWVHPSNGHDYQLKLVLGDDFPDEMPKLYVVSPHMLRKYGGGMANEMEISHAFHTWENGPGGCVQICHCRPDRWDSSKTICGVMIKGILWLEGYARHLRTGQSIASFFDEMRRSMET